MKKYAMLIAVLFACSFVFAACGNKDEKASDDQDGEEKTEEANAEEDGNEDEDDQNNEDTSGAVEPKSSSETISFEQTNWIGGSPDREADPGVWYYTEDDHPEKYDDTFDWDEEDVLLWQIDDKKYEGASADTQKLEVMDNDVIKVVVELEEGDSDDDRAPRNFLKVPKDKLDGKSYIVETEDGEELTVD